MATCVNKGCFMDAIMGYNKSTKGMIQGDIDDLGFFTKPDWLVSMIKLALTPPLPH